MERDCFCVRYPPELPNPATSFSCRGVTMRAASLILASLLHFTGLLLSQVSQSQASPSDKPQLLNSYGDTPLSFEFNEGQAPAGVQFLSHSAGSSVELGADRAVLTL